jgi:hypothetical protein
MSSTVFDAKQAFAAAVQKIDEDVPPAVEKLRAACSGIVDSALDLARAARSTGRSGQMAAVKPPAANEPEPEGEITKRFRALR